MASGYQISTAGKGAVLATTLFGAMMCAATPAVSQEAVAGSTIANVAEIRFVQLGDALQSRSNTVETLVAERLDVAVAAINAQATPVRGGERSQALAFRVGNRGNGSEPFVLDAASVPGGLATTITGIAIDRDGDGRYDPAIDTPYRAGVDDPILAPGQTITVFVMCDIAAGSADGSSGSVRLTARAVTGTGAEGTPFAGRGDGGGDAIVGVTGADDAATAGVVVSTAAARLTKSQTVTDRNGGMAAIPGSIITYELKVQISGSRALDDIGVTDAIPAGTTYIADSLRLNGQPLSDASDTDAGRAGTSGIEVALGTLSPGMERLLSFQVRIN